MKKLLLPLLTLLFSSTQSFAGNAGFSVNAIYADKEVISGYQIHIEGTQADCLATLIDVIKSPNEAMQAEKKSYRVIAANADCTPVQSEASSTQQAKQDNYFANVLVIKATASPKKKLK